MDPAWRGAISVFPVQFLLVLMLFGVGPVQAQNSGATGDPEFAGVSEAAIKARAESGDARAQNELGLAYATGKAGATNYVLAREWFSKAAEQGVPAAQHNLASLFFGGRGVPQNFEEGLSWYRKAAEQGFVQSQFFLGWVYAMGKGGVEPNFTEAAKWYGMAADQGDPEAQLQLGLLYLRGENLKPQYVEAYKWINVAAGNGSFNAAKHRAQLNLALSREEIRLAQAQASEYLLAKTRQQTSPSLAGR